MKVAYWSKAKTYLKKKDPVLKEIINGYPDPEYLRRSDCPFISLLRSITGQQISVAAADSIWKRFAEKLGKITPEALLAMDDTALRGVGFSNQKTLYMKNIARFFEEHVTDDQYWQKPFADIQRDLIQIKGIGKWTTEMFGIFYLNEPDIFPEADLGLLKAIYRHYYSGEKVPVPTILELAEMWRPYRSVAVWYLWRSLDPVAVQY